MPNRKSSTDAKTASKQDKGVERTGLKSDELLVNAKRALKAAKEELRHEQLARIKAGQALVEAQTERNDPRLEVKRGPYSPVRRVSFIVRLIFDEHSSAGRTEIEHVSSNKKLKFPTLDGEGLVAFMKDCADSELRNKNINLGDPSEEV